MPRRLKGNRLHLEEEGANGEVSFDISSDRETGFQTKTVEEEGKVKDSDPNTYLDKLKCPGRG